MIEGRRGSIWQRAKVDDEPRRCSLAARAKTWSGTSTLERSQGGDTTLLASYCGTDKVITFEQERHQPEDGNCPHLTRLGNGDGLVVKLFHRKGLHLGTTKSTPA